MTGGVGDRRERVLCVAPAWNEEGRIGSVVTSVPREWVDEIVVVDDGSTDETACRAAASGAHVLRETTNRGVGAAIRRALDYARQRGYEIVVVVSGGGKTPPEQIPSLLQPLLAGEADFVQGSRYAEGGVGSGMPLSRAVGTRAYTLLFSILAGRRVTDASSGFRAFRVSILDDPRINLHQEWLDRYELEPYLLFKVLQSGHRVREVPVTIAYPARSRTVPYTRMRSVIDWWGIFRPALFLRLGLKR